MSPLQMMKDKQHCRLLSEWLKYCPVLVHNNSRGDQKSSFLLHGKQVWTISNKLRVGKILVKKTFASGFVLKIARSFHLKTKSFHQKGSIQFWVLFIFQVRSNIILWGQVTVATHLFLPPQCFMEVAVQASCLCLVMNCKVAAWKSQERLNLP